MGADKWVWRAALFVALITALRIVSLWFNTTELFFDEAQYWVWGREPAFGYFSKPPLLAWIIGATTSVCGDSEFCVRLASPVLHGATAAMVFFVARLLFDGRTAFFAALTYGLIPAVTLSAGLVSTDVPLLFCWSLALYAFLRFETSNSWGWAVALGTAIGLGLMAKYAMAYFLLCAVIYSLAVAERPHVLARPLFWLALVVAGLLVAPNLWWNAANNFATVSHTGENIGWGDRFPNISGFAEFAASQLAVMGPILFGIFVATLVRLARQGMSATQWFLVAFSLPVLALISGQALMSKAYANWAALTYVAGTILVADIMVNRIPPLWLRFSTALHLLVFAVLSVAVAFSLPGQLPLPREMEPFARMHGAISIASEARKHLAAGNYAAIMVDDRRLAALMHYYLRDAGLPVVSWRAGEVPRDHFELTRPWQATRPSPVLYLTRNTNPAPIVAAFGDTERVGEFETGSREIGLITFYAMRTKLDTVQ